ncbi:hypothetical protein D5086_008910 [Populus alba]|uniref:Uncharacterized protein n=1 Tax=Populus alba TaxID=43335 RepID=A0ACC4CJ83_POPAL
MSRIQKPSVLILCVLRVGKRFEIPRNVDFDETEKENFELHDDGLGFSGAGGDKKHLDAPALEVKELFARAVEGAKLARLCKELPTHKPATIARILNGQRKWMRKAVRKPSFLKLGKEQREILVGLLFLTGKLLVLAKRLALTPKANHRWLSSQLLACQYMYGVIEHHQGILWVKNKGESVLDRCFWKCFYMVLETAGLISMKRRLRMVTWTANRNFCGHTRHCMVQLLFSGICSETAKVENDWM